MFSPEETAACRRLVQMALEEDLDNAGDLTSQAIIPATRTVTAAFVTRARGVLAGLPAVALVVEEVDPKLTLRPLKEDGAFVEPGDQVATVAGSIRSLLTVERTALNFLQRLSGIATLTHRYVSAVEGLRVQILDTRKTTPGWRRLEKYAVRCGGGRNHRMGLYDGILIKDNHLAALGGGTTSVDIAIQKAREVLRHPMTLEIEVDSLEQLNRALACFPNVVLLDNMSLEQLREAVRRRDTQTPAVHLEASGGVTLDNVRAIAETGVDRISVGALTHSAPALDIGLDYEST